MTRSQHLRALAERVDRLVSLDVSGRGVIEALYRDARGRSDPLCLQAARVLQRRVRPGNHVFIASGWHDRPHVNSQVAETDGPLGAAVLALTLHRVCGAVPLLLVESRLIGPMQEVLRAAGLCPLAPEEAEAAAAYRATLHAATVIGFSKNAQEAQTQSEHLLAALKPRAVLAVEVGGMNADGNIFTFRGDDTTHHTPKFDFLFAAARRRRITTIGIGDGGNEIGFGSSRPRAVRHVPATAQPAEAIVPVQPVDHLVPAAVSNWGAYGIAACLCLLARTPEHVHRPEFERRLLEAASRAGLIDGITGYIEPTVDGIAADVHAGLVALLQAIVEHGCSSGRS